MAARTFVVGDLHGCIDELNVLLDDIGPTNTDTIVFLGDYIDRGPSSRAVIDRLLRLRSEGSRGVFLKGNHEDMFLAYMGFPGHYGDVFLANGGRATLASYGLDDCAGSQVADQIPPDHRDFLLALEPYHAAGEFFCVHAGINPLRSVADQREEDLFWIREEFIRNHHRLPYTVLFGHTPHREVFLDLPYKIGLDTGLVYQNKLSCLELSGLDLLQVRRGERRAQKTSLAGKITTQRGLRRKP